VAVIITAPDGAVVVVGAVVGAVVGVVPLELPLLLLGLPQAASSKPNARNKSIGKVRLNIGQALLIVY